MNLYSCHLETTTVDRIIFNSAKAASRADKSLTQWVISSLDIGMTLFTLINISALTWDEIRVKHAWPTLCGISGTLAAHRKQKNTLPSTDLDTRGIAHRPVWPQWPAFYRDQKRGRGEVTWWYRPITVKSGCALGFYIVFLMVLCISKMWS